jgi:hypothetical protein
VDPQDLAYALNQVVHNFGAVAVTAGAAGGRWAHRVVSGQDRRRYARVTLGGWVAQGSSGAAFGAISYANYGQLPDIHGIAIVALSVKIACAAFGLALSALYLTREALWTEQQRQRTWTALLSFGAVALCAAAFLRWFS